MFRDVGGFRMDERGRDSFIVSSFLRLRYRFLALANIIVIEWCLLSKM